MNKEKIKTIIIALLALLLIIACVFLFKGTNKNEYEFSEPAKDEIITTQPAIENPVSVEDTSEVKETVCRNFLTTYYTVYHAKSKLVNLPECRKYITDYLYSSLSPENENSAEYSADEIDIDYSSSISINQCYQNINNPNKLLVNCTIKKTVNDLQSINDYFILFTLDDGENGWLINQFELISQGD